MKSINSTKVRNHFGELMDQVHHRQESIIVERRGRPYVAIVPLSSGERGGEAFGPLSLKTFDGGGIVSSLSRQELYGDFGR